MVFDVMTLMRNSPPTLVASANDLLPVVLPADEDVSAPFKEAYVPRRTLRREANPTSETPLGAGDRRFTLGEVLQYLREHFATASKLFFDTRPVAGSVRTGSGDIVVPLSHQPVYLVFLDDDPLANWAHDCRYAFISEAGVLDIVRHNYPPLEDINLVEV